MGGLVGEYVHDVGEDRARAHERHRHSDEGGQHESHDYEDHADQGLLTAIPKFDYSFLMHLIYKTLKREGVTTLMTVSRPQGTVVPQDTGVEEFVADGIFELRNYISRDVEMKTQFIIRKLRGTEHSRKFHSVLFTPHGVEVLPYTP